MHDLGPTASRVADVVRGVSPDDLARPTPCAEYSVADLLDHLDGLSAAFTMAARHAPGDGAPDVDGSRLGDDWQARIPQRLDELAEAWRDPDAWTGMTGAGGVDLPGEVAGAVALNELVLHGWDTAAATGQQITFDEESIALCRGFVDQFSGPGTEEARGGLFGPELPVPNGATPLETLLALSGRDPAWRAGG